MKVRDALELLLLSAIWGASFLLISIAVQSFSPTWVALIRVTFGSAFLWTVLLAKRRILPPRRLIGWLLLVALFNNAIPFVFFAIGERTVPSSIAALINATTPIWALLLSLSFMKQKSEGRTIPGVLLGFFGVILVVYSHGADAVAVGSVHSYAVGVLFIALASAGYAVATVLANITLGVAGSGLAYLLYYSLLDRISSTRVVSVTYLLPIWGLFWGSIAHEHSAAPAYVGVAIVIFGFTCSTVRAPRSRHSRKSTPIENRSKQAPTRPMPELRPSNASHHRQLL